MLNVTSPCIYPLVDTIHSPYITIHKASCGISCTNTRNFLMLFTSNEEKKLRSVLFLISTLSICLLPVYFCTVIMRKFRTGRSFFSLPFTYQCPLFISCGFFLVSFIPMSPFLVGAATIICNEDDQTLTKDTLHNIPCSLTAIGLYVGIRLALFYNCAFSISLVITMYKPKTIQLKRYFHLSIWTFIAIGIIPVILRKSVTGDLHLGFCTTSLTSPQNIVSYNMIPLAVSIVIFFVCWAMASRKQIEQNKELFDALSVKKDLQSFFKRLWVYNMLQTTALAAVLGNFCYWYVRIDSWKNTARSIIMCQVRSTLLKQTSAHDYEYCIRTNSELPRPPLWTYWFLSFCGLLSVLGAMIFHCTVKVQQQSLDTLRGSLHTLHKLAGSISSRIGEERSTAITVESFLSCTESEGESTYVTTSIEALESSESEI